MKVLDKIKTFAHRKEIAKRGAMMEETVLLYPDPHLSAPNEFVDFSKTTREDRVEILQRLNAALNAQEWGGRLGIAAPQIGLNLRVCVVAGIPMFNPTFTPPKHNPMVKMVEGCYSLSRNDLYEVERFKYGWVKWYDVDGVYHDVKYNGIKAIIAQHEISHLDGKCCNQLGTPCKKS